MDIGNQIDIVQPSVDDLALTATHPQDMIVAQNQLIQWCDKKIMVESADCEELRQSYERARKMKWKHAPLYALWQKSAKKIEYYQKVKGALEQGFYIVPNFPIQMFAIRKRGKGRPKGHSNSYWGDHEQKHDQLPVGEGEYQNPFPIVERDRQQLSDGKVLNESYPVEWDTLEFPITMAKPEIMDVTQLAMKLKIFDRIGVMPAVRKKEDPVIIGQIVNKTGNNEKVISFMIAWHLNTNVL